MNKKTFATISISLYLLLCICFVSCTMDVTTTNDNISIAPKITFTNGTVHVSPDSVATIAIIIIYDDIELKSVFDYSDHSGTLSAKLPKNKEITVRIEGIDKDNNVIYFGEQTIPGASKDTIISISASQVTPTSPTDLLALYVAQSTIQLTWNDKSSNETGFIIFKSVGTNLSYSAIDTVPKNTKLFHDTKNISSGTAYYYKVSAYNKAGESKTIVSMYDPKEKVAKPQTPQGTQEGFINSSYKYWTDNTSTCGNGHKLEYRFDWDNNNDFTPWLLKAEAVGSWNISGTYNVKVQARCSKFNAIVSEWSDAFVVTVN